MPIGLEQWRMSIGALEAQRHSYLSRATRKAARRRARGYRTGWINPGKANYGRMVVGITLLGLVASLSLLLLRAGDVERNPGPLPDEPITKLDDSQLTGGLDSSQQQLSSTHTSTSGFHIDSAAGLPKTQVTSSMANDPGQKESLEYKTVRQHFSKLVASAINPLTLSLELFSAGLIDEFKLNEMTTTDSSDQIKTIGLFKAVLSEVERDSRKFHVLMQALNEMPSMTQLVQSMMNIHAQGCFSPPPAKLQNLDTGLQDSMYNNPPQRGAQEHTSQETTFTTPSIPGAPVPLTVDDVTDVCDILKEARFKASDWRSLAARLRVDDPESIIYRDQALCLEEVLRQWIHKFKQAATWEKLATEVSKVSGYGPGTKETILELAAKRGTRSQHQKDTKTVDGGVAGVGEPQMMMHPGVHEISHASRRPAIIIINSGKLQQQLSR